MARRLQVACKCSVPSMILVRPSAGDPTTTSHPARQRGWPSGQDEGPGFAWYLASTRSETSVCARISAGFASYSQASCRQGHMR